MQSSGNMLTILQTANTEALLLLHTSRCSYISTLLCTGYHLAKDYWPQLTFKRLFLSTKTEKVQHAEEITELGLPEVGKVCLSRKHRLVMRYLISDGNRQNVGRKKFKKLFLKS